MPEKGTLAKKKKKGEGDKETGGLFSFFQVNIHFTSLL